MKTFLAFLLAGLALSTHADTPTNATPAVGTTVETIVCVRHGEKPKGGLGQLNSRGLNRALALPDVLLGKFGNPQYIFAPSPEQKVDSGTKYYYIRPLMTIEPTAIRCGLPVNAEFGFQDIAGLEQELAKPEYQNATIFVAWEHTVLDEFAKKILADNGGDAKEVPKWPGTDFDTIFVFKVTRDGANKSITLTLDHEGLNDMSDNFPKPATK